MFETNLNDELSDLLQQHGVTVIREGEWLLTGLQENLRMKASAFYTKVNGRVSSRLDITADTGSKQILESFGDVGLNPEEAFERNFWNFSAGTLHPLLAAFGLTDPHTLEQVTTEQWNVNGKEWTAYIGHLVPKFTAGEVSTGDLPTIEFFTAVQDAIRTRPLDNGLHWFRSYYCQFGNAITETEFLQDNEPVPGQETFFASMPVLSGVHFLSCRNFMVLKRS